MTELRICQCGSCQAAFDRGASLFKKMMADNECPVFAFGVAEAMSMFSQYLLTEMTAAQLGNAGFLFATLGSDIAAGNVRNTMVDHAKAHPKRFAETIADLCSAYNELVDRNVADNEARAKDTPNIKTPKGG